ALFAAYAAGGATLADFYDHLVGPRTKSGDGRERFHVLQLATGMGQKDLPLIDQRPELREAVNKTVARIIEIELARGETPTAATAPANEIQQVFGIDTLLNLVA